jgi:DNA repair protein RecO (recombination protein O)
MSARSPSYVTEAVVLRLTDFGEADRVVTLLTRARGKITALAKGARRSRHRFGAALAPFGHGEATLRESRGAMPLLEGLYAARGFPGLLTDLARLSHGSYALELCQELCPPGEPEPEVLRLLLDLLSTLDAMPAGDRPSALLLRIFELRLLQAVGLGLSLSACAACGQEVPPLPLLPFDRLRGGVLCDACVSAGSRGGGHTAEPLRQAVRDALVALSRLSPADLDEAAALRLMPAEQVACRDLLLAVIRHHLGKNLRAVEFIAKMNLVHS